MAGTQEKIQLLLKIAHRLNEAGVEWALGASMMLYFKDITSDFHDIDLMVVDRDAECVRTILSEMRKKCLSPAKKLGACKCVCWTTAFFLLPSPGSLITI